ncbi:YqjF family protein [Arthrobacter sp. ISL-28]|uniref:YqjF family protein n=1 Tax=Arthrobacter sp. ISL-28 TaxID=2819108 RepID=UPI0037BEF200
MAAAQPYMPQGVEPDVYADMTWVGLIGFRVTRTCLGSRLRLPYVGAFTEVNVRLYSRDAAGQRGVVFLSLDADRLAFVLAGRAAGLRYVWSRCRSTTTNGTSRGYAYEVERFHGKGTSSFTAYPDVDHRAVDGLSLWLTARFGIHTRMGQRAVYLPIAHPPWRLYCAAAAAVEDGLVRAAGLTVHGPPDSVLYSAGVRTQFGQPRQLDGRSQNTLGRRLILPSLKPLASGGRKGGRSWSKAGIDHPCAREETCPSRQ